MTSETLEFAGATVPVIAQEKKVQSEHPGSLAYMVGSTTVSYGMARQYEATAGLEETGIVVVHALSDLPEEILRKLPAGSGEP